MTPMVGGPSGLNAKRFLTVSEDDLRDCGLSRRKAGHVLGLAESVVQRQIRLDSIGRLRQERIVEELSVLDGVGPWTAQMFMIFSLGRLNIFPEGDFGVRSAIRHFYHLESLPDAKTCNQIGTEWQPFASIGAWYCWKSLDRHREELRKSMRRK